LVTRNCGSSIQFDHDDSFGYIIASNAQSSCFLEVIMTTSLPNSGIWSSLFTLESTSQYAEPSKTYNSLPRGATGGPPKLHKRHQTLAAAVAIIGASSPESNTVTACSTEISFPTVILRIAQNQVVDQNELRRLQDLVDVVIQEVQGRDIDWAVKSGMSFSAENSRIIFTSICRER
jgi:hypothetical protein